MKTEDFTKLLEDETKEMSGYGANRFQRGADWAYDILHANTGLIPLAELTPATGYDLNNSILDREVFNKEDMRKCYESAFKMGISYVMGDDADNFMDFLTVSNPYFETYLNNIAR